MPSLGNPGKARDGPPPGPRQNLLRPRLRIDDDLAGELRRVETGDGSARPSGDQDTVSHCVSYSTGALLLQAGWSCATLTCGIRLKPDPTQRDRYLAALAAVELHQEDALPPPEGQAPL